MVRRGQYKSSISKSGYTISKWWEKYDTGQIKNVLYFIDFHLCLSVDLKLIKDYQDDKETIVLYCIVNID